jgi:hypothetical protein
MGPGTAYGQNHMSFCKAQTLCYSAKHKLNYYADYIAVFWSALFFSQELIHG